MFRTLFAKAGTREAPQRPAVADEPPAPVGDRDYRRLGGPFCGQASRHAMLCLLDEEARQKTAAARGR